MKLNVLFSPVNADELYFTNKTTVVIDVLRASSTIITALSNGAIEVIPVASVDFAVKLSGGMFGGKTLLGGERNTKMIEGFALGNSPFEYSNNVVGSKYIVFYSTNGSKAIVKAKYSENLFVGSFNNLRAVADHLTKLNNDIEILCAGNNTRFSLEDSACAGMLIEEMRKKHFEVELSDSSLAALALYNEFGTNILEMLKHSEHGKKLLENGFEKDLEYCSNYSVTSSIPSFEGNTLKLLNLQPVQSGVSTDG
ncbi:MAG: 2-phosphosulfolactate phosphatase [Ignavibacterium sp.]|nr:MAG: 2-phosphosulfolactate phosphatase [Ignavibacterium sp.]